MKVRNGFVSNSSSSSFIVSKTGLSKSQKRAILNPKLYIQSHFIQDQINSGLWIQKDTGEMYQFYDIEEQWVISDNGNTITGSTYMDNFDMCTFFEYLKIPEKNYKFRS